MNKASIFLILTFFTFNVISVDASNQRLEVVTSFSILEDITKELGGEHINIINLVPRNNDAHMYIPTPSDAAAIDKADLIIFNGLGFEGWIYRLLEDAGGRGVQLNASRGVDFIMNDNEVDPHAWQSFQNIKIYVTNISEMLIILMPQFSEYLLNRQKVYLKKLDDLENELNGKISKISISKRIVVTSHDAFGYLGREFNIKFLAPQGFSLDVEATAKDVAAVVDQIRNEQVSAIFVENINNPKLLNTIAKEANVEVGGRLYSDALSEIDGLANSYLNMMQHNIQSIIKSLDN